MDIKGKHVLVIGTQKPWIEVILLELGAALVTTVGTMIKQAILFRHVQSCLFQNMPESTVPIQS